MILGKVGIQGIIVGQAEGRRHSLVMAPDAHDPLLVLCFVCSAAELVLTCTLPVVCPAVYLPCRP